jgi:ribonuclease HII
MQKQFNKNIIEIGLDEAGRGPLIGNVYVGAVIWDDELNPPEGLINDSKKLSKKKRKEALEWIKNNVKNYAIGYASNEEIDNINILEATKLAMGRAIDQIQIKTKYLIIDGIGWQKKFPEYNVTSVIKGDSKFYSIAAASILAKEYHDQHILELCKNDTSLHEKYLLESNMGYPSKTHIEGIKKYGYTKYHRKSYKLKCLA